MLAFHGGLVVVFKPLWLLGSYHHDTWPRLWLISTGGSDDVLGWSWNGVLCTGDKQRTRFIHFVE